jgi:GGDEF domain-containing protein
MAGPSLHAVAEVNHLNQLVSATSDWLRVAALLGDVAFELDVEFRFSAFGALSMFGHQTPGLLNRRAADILVADGEALSDILVTVRNELVIWHGQINLQHADGTARICRLALAPKLNGNGKVVGVYGLIIDLTAPELNAAVTASEPKQDRVLDPETGLWNVTTFIEQASRRFDRLEVENQPGTLLFLGFGRAQPSMQTPTAMRLADELREIVRPTDLLGRINRTTIALWCDGMDHLTGGERAARFCKHLPAALPDHPLISVGLATRWPGHADDVASVVERASLALKDAYAATARDGAGSWRVWQTEPPG